MSKKALWATITIVVVLVVGIFAFNNAYQKYQAKSQANAFRSSLQKIADDAIKQSQNNNATPNQATPSQAPKSRSLETPPPADKPSDQAYEDARQNMLSNGWTPDKKVEIDGAPVFPGQTLYGYTAKVSDLPNLSECTNFLVILNDNGDYSFYTPNEPTSSLNFMSDYVVRAGLQDEFCK